MTLGRIIVDLLAKTGSFETDINRSAKLADKRAKEIDAAFKRAGRAIGLALVTATTAVAAAIKSNIDRMDDLSKAAQRANLPTEQFSALAYAGELADVSMQDLQSALGKLAKAQGDSLKLTSEQGRFFKALGIEVADTSGKLRNTYQVFLDFADVFQQHKGSPEVMAAGMNIFGRSFQNLIPLLKDGREGLEAAAEEAERLGLIVSDEAGRAAEQFNDDLTRLKRVLTGVGTGIAQEMLPRLTQLAEEFLSSATEGDGLANAAERIGRSFAEAITWVANLHDNLTILRATMAKFEADASRFSPAAMLRGLVDGGDFANEMKAASDKAAATIEAAQARIAGRDKVPVRIITGRLPAGGGGGLDIRERAKAKSGGGKSKEEKEAEKLLAAYERLEASLREQIALHGETTEVAKLRYDLEHGELSKLSQAQKDTLLGLAQQRDEQIAATKVTEEGKRLTESLLTPTEELNKLREEANELLQKGAITQETYNKALESYKDPGQQMLDDLRFELELLKMTNAERATAIMLRGLEAEEVAKYGARIAKANQDIEDSLKEIAFMDDVRGEFEDFFVSLVDGSKSAGDAIKDLFNNIAAMITRMIAERWVEQIFGGFGTSGQGSKGGNWLSSLFGAFFGGGREHGGPVGKGGTYLVGERGPELFVPRSAGTIIPAQQTARLAGAGGAPMVVNFQLPSMVTRQTEVQAQQRLAQASQRATRRNS